MSDSEPIPPEQQKPSKKTSTVPLKKETARITLRARPEETGPVIPQGVTQPIRPVGAPADGGAPVQPITGSIPPIGSTMPVPAQEGPAGSVPPIGSTMPIPGGQDVTAAVPVGQEGIGAVPPIGSTLPIPGGMKPTTGSVPPIGSTMPIPGNEGRVPEPTAAAPTAPPPTPNIAPVGPRTNSPTDAPAPPPAPETPALGQPPVAAPPPPTATAAAPVPAAPPVSPPPGGGAKTVNIGGGQTGQAIPPPAALGAQTVPLSKAPAPAGAPAPAAGCGCSTRWGKNHSSGQGTCITCRSSRRETNHSTC